VFLPEHAEDLSGGYQKGKRSPFIKQSKEWQKAINQLLKMGVKAEQQALAKHGLNYVIEKYLPQKLKKVDSFLP
jgi:DNA topoisomerase-6 subunit A